MPELFKNVTKARDAVLDVVKQVPTQIQQVGTQVQNIVKEIDLRDFRTLPQQLRTQADKLDLTTKLTVPQVFTDRVGQVKVFAPIDVDAVQTRVAEVGGYLQTLPGKIEKVPGFVQGFVTDFPDSASKLATDTTSKARTIVEDLKNRPIFFVPQRTKPVATKKTTTKKKTTTAKKAKSTKATNGATSPSANGSAPEQPTL